MYEELVKELWKYCHAWLDDKPYDIPKLAMEAAEAIEKLEAKNKELENKMHDSFTEHLLNQISRKEKQIEDLKATCKKECEARQRQADIIQDLKGTIYQQISKIDEKSKLEKELEQVKAEKEAALRDFKKIAQEGLCTVCEHYNCDLSDTICADCKGTPYIITDNFQWRGVQGGKDD